MVALSYHIAVYSLTESRIMFKCYRKYNMFTIQETKIKNQVLTAVLALVLDEVSIKVMYRFYVLVIEVFGQKIEISSPCPQL